MKIKPLETKSLVVVAVGVIWLALRLSADINGVSFLMMMSSYRLGTSVLLAGLVVAFLRLGVPLFPMLLKPRQKRSKTAYKGAKVALSNGVEALLPDKVEVDVGNVHERGIEVVDLTASEFNPNIKAGSKWKEFIPYEGQVGKLYNIDDLVYPLDSISHFLVSGSTGSAKTRCSFKILDALNKNFNADFILCDYGNFDFKRNKVITNTEDIIYHIGLVYDIMRGRQLEGKQDYKRIFFLIEEAEGFLDDIKATKTKKEYERIIYKLSQIGRLARKCKISLYFIAQSAKASQFDTGLRNNLNFRFVLRSDNRASAMLGCNDYKTSNLRPGYAWVSTLNEFVEFNLIDEPLLPTIGFRELEALVSFYKRNFNLEVEAEKTS